GRTTHRRFVHTDCRGDLRPCQAHAEERTPQHELSLALDDNLGDRANRLPAPMEPAYEQACLHELRRDLVALVRSEQPVGDLRIRGRNDEFESPRLNELDSERSRPAVLLAHDHIRTESRLRMRDLGQLRRGRGMQSGADQLTGGLDLRPRYRQRGRNRPKTPGREILEMLPYDRARKLNPIQMLQLQKQGLAQIARPDADWAVLAQQGEHRLDSTPLHVKFRGELLYVAVEKSTLIERVNEMLKDR